MENNMQDGYYSSLPPSENVVPVNMSITDLKRFAGWATFHAVVDIIAGALACLGIITAAYGIPMIIAGVKLLGASDELRRYISTQNMQRISVAFQKLYGYFKVSGISLVIKISFIILGLILYGVFIAMIISRLPEIMQDFPGSRDFFPGGDFPGGF